MPALNELRRGKDEIQNFIAAKFIAAEQILKFIAERELCAKFSGDQAAVRG